MCVCGGGGYLSRYSDSLRAGRSGDRIPMRARFSTPFHTDPWALPASCTVSTGTLQGVKRPERGVDHPSPYSVEVKERVELLHIWAFVPCYRVTFNFSFYLIYIYFRWYILSFNTLDDVSIKMAASSGWMTDKGGTWILFNWRTHISWKDTKCVP